MLNALKTENFVIINVILEFAYSFKNFDRSYFPLFIILQQNESGGFDFAIFGYYLLLQRSKDITHLFLPSCLIFVHIISKTVIFSFLS